MQGPNVGLISYPLYFISGTLEAGGGGGRVAGHLEGGGHVLLPFCLKSNF